MLYFNFYATILYSFVLRIGIRKIEDIQHTYLVGVEDDVACDLVC